MQEVLESQQTVLEGVDEREMIFLVEDALRHLYDYPYLGDHKLAQLHIVESHLDIQEGAFVTHLDRGKGLAPIYHIARFLCFRQAQPRDHERALHQRGHLQSRPPPGHPRGSQGIGGDGEGNPAKDSQSTVISDQLSVIGVYCLLVTGHWSLVTDH